ncbi:hypothetical protein WDA79_13580 [Streptomyces sp. A475]|uniref:hypothetical protein n=1 Tax=Streptomyces sp. A475 TaxID=3131976 RepID=UPI0030C9EE9B
MPWLLYPSITSRRRTKNRSRFGESRAEPGPPSGVETVTAAFLAGDSGTPEALVFRWDNLNLPKSDLAAFNPRLAQNNAAKGDS